MQSWVVGVRAFEVHVADVCVLRRHHLSNGMHRVLWCAAVDCEDARKRGYDGANGASTTTV